MWYPVDTCCPAYVWCPADVLCGISCRCMKLPRRVMPCKCMMSCRWEKWCVVREAKQISQGGWQEEPECGLCEGTPSVLLFICLCLLRSSCYIPFIFSLFEIQSECLISVMWMRSWNGVKQAYSSQHSIPLWLATLLDVGHWEISKPQDTQLPWPSVSWPFSFSHY